MKNSDNQGSIGIANYFPNLHSVGEEPSKPLIEGGSEETFSKGEYIFRPGDHANCLYLLQSGRVKLGAFSDGAREIIKAILKPGEVFGELVMLDVRKRRDYAVAMDAQVTVRALTVAELKTVMQQNAEFSLRITMVLGQRLEKTEQRLDSLVSKDARTRVVEFLLELAQKTAKQEENEVQVHDFFTHRDIASLTATSRQTVTSILNDLREKGVISFDRKHLHIHNLDALRTAG